MAAAERLEDKDAALQARLEAMHTRRKEQADQEEKAQELRQLEVFELEQKLEGELKGKRGVDFEIIDNRFGLFALRRPDTRAIRNWEQASDEKKQSLEWQTGVLRHYIYPSDQQIPWAQLATERPGLCWQTANAFVDLMGVDRSNLEKKR